jgi:3-phenylpropionate/trans-cinnamate dioxygenase ferredoxin reductase subunit
MGNGVVIIGTGQAGFQTAASLRTEGYQEKITLIGEEPHIPYQRPPLSKSFLLGTQDLASLELRPRNFYQDHRIELLAGENVSAIDCAAKQVRLESGGHFPYDKLVLAVGGRNRKLSIDGAELDGVLYLRSLDEAVILKERIEQAREIVVVGGGFIGLEIAAVARTLGKSVTVLEALPRLMSRAVAQVISDFYGKMHRSKGVQVLCEAAVSKLEGANGKVHEVLLSDGTRLPADLVLVGVGIVPNVELARNAGLSIANGIAVNDFLQTSDEDIFAIGDCAEYPCEYACGRIRLESVQNAADQAQCVAAAIAVRPKIYRALPWFWTDQFDVKLQMAGLSNGHDCTVSRGSAETSKLSVFYFKEGQLIAIDSINRPLDHMMGRKLIAQRVRLTPDQAGDESVDLKKLASSSGVAHG